MLVFATWKPKMPCVMYVDSIIEMKSMNFLNAQATIEKVRQKSI